ncbi:MAG: tetratricopeptide repeat protein [Telluria sp.]
MQDSLAGAVATADTTSLMQVRTLGPQEINALFPMVEAWAKSHAIDHFRDLHRNIQVRQATLIPVPWVQLRTRYELRALSNKWRPYSAGDAFESRRVNEGDFPIWSYQVRNTSEKIIAGKIPDAITRRVPNSDVIADCTPCDARGNVTCDTCAGDGSLTCGACAGHAHVRCGSCSGDGQKKCSSCSGRGEKDCYMCSAGRRADGSRCTHCAGRGYEPCSSCRNGFNNCKTCMTKGEVRCAACGANGRVVCGPCSGHGQVVCGACEGSGDVINSFYITSTQRESLTLRHLLPQGYQSLVPPDVDDWLRNSLTVKKIRSMQADRFEALPMDHADRPVADAGQALLAEACSKVRWKSDSEKWKLSFGAQVDKIISQWYSENQVPLVKVDYSYEGHPYVLWCAAPCATTENAARSGKPHARYFKPGISVYASDSPIQEYVDELHEQAHTHLKQGQYKEADLLADAVLASMPNDRDALALKEEILDAHNVAAFTGGACAVGCIFLLYKSLSSVFEPLSGWSLALWIGIGLIISAGAFAIPRVVYSKKAVAVALQFALLSLISLPFVYSKKLPGVTPKAAGKTAPAAAPAKEQPMPQVVAAQPADVEAPAIAVVAQDEAAAAPPQTTAPAEADMLVAASKCTELDDCLRFILKGAAESRREVMQMASARVLDLPRPAQGDRKAARKLNADALRELSNGNVEGAIELFTNAQQLDASDAEIQSNLAIALNKANEPQRALDAIRTALLIDPKRTGAWVSLAETCDLLGKADVAIASLLVAYEVSTNKDKTVASFLERSTGDESGTLKAAYRAALQRMKP